VVYVKLFLTAVLWGGTFIAARVVSQDVGPFSAAFFRFFIASAFLLFFAVRLEGGLPRLAKGQVFLILLLGLTGVAAYNVFFFSGLKSIAAGRASLIIATNPVFIALFAALLFRERLTLLNGAGILLCVTGALIVLSKGNPLIIFQGGLGRGELYIAGCVVSWVLYSLIGKAAMKDLSPLAAVTFSCLVGTAVLFVPALREGMAGQFLAYGWSNWWGMFYLGFFGSVLGFTWFYEGIKKIGASRAAVFINFVPVNAVILAYLILHERIYPSLLIGAALVIGGAYMTNKRDRIL